MPFSSAALSCFLSLDLLRVFSPSADPPVRCRIPPILLPAAQLDTALLLLPQFVRDYRTPAEKVLSRDLTSRLNKQIEFLAECRPLAVAMGNAIKHLKLVLSQLDHSSSEEAAKARVLDAINTYVQVRLPACRLALSPTSRARALTSARLPRRSVASCPLHPHVRCAYFSVFDPVLSPTHHPSFSCPDIFTVSLLPCLRVVSVPDSVSPSFPSLAPAPPLVPFRLCPSVPPHLLATSFLPYDLPRAPSYPYSTRSTDMVSLLPPWLLLSPHRRKWFMPTAPLSPMP